MAIVARGAERLSATGRSAIAFVPAIGILAVWAALMPADGGYFARDWIPAGILIALLWLVAVIGGGRLAPPGWPVRAALGALAGLVGLAFLSVLWAESQATAWATASQFMTVVLAVWTLALVPWRALPVQLLMGAFGLAAAVALGGSLLSATGAEDLTGRFVDGRWAQPIGYPNGLGNFGFFAALPVLAVSAAPGRHWVLRALMVALAAFLAGCALLPQSRGSLVGVVIGCVALVALSPLRWRMAARLAIVAGALAVFSGPILDLYDAATRGTGVGDAVDEAARSIVLATLLAGIAGVVVALAESRVRVPERFLRTAGIVVLALLALGGTVAVAANAGRIERFADRQREAWSNPGPPEFAAEPQAGTSRLLSDNPLQRYAYWHVALDAFAERPLVGAGAGGFEARYTRVRQERKYSSFPHSLFLRTLAEGGLIGALGVLLLIGAVLVALLRGLRRASTDDRLVTAGALAAAVCFLVHAQLDWLEEFPSLAGPALGFLIAAMVLRRGPVPVPRLSWPDVAGAGVLAVVALLVLVPPYAALRYRERASAVWRTDAALAYRDLARARALDPLSDKAHLSEGTIALQRREYDRARSAFEGAVAREDAWLAHFELALIDAAQGDRVAAMRQLERAAAQNPQEPAIAAAREEIESGEVVDPVRLNRRLFESSLFKAQRLT